jgi:hypothetical protein
MPALRTLLQLLMAVIYALYLCVLCWVPAAELLRYISRETRLFSFTLSLPVQDLVLPGLLLALVYAAIATLQRKICPKPAAEPIGEPAGEKKHAAP